MANTPKFEETDELVDTPKFEDTAPVSFEDTLPTDSAPPHDVSKLESLGRGIQQGATLGSGDEISGGINALLHLGSKVLPYESGYGDVGQAYREGRDANRDENKTAQEANRGSYFAGEMAGGALTSLAPGLGFLNASKGAGVAEAALKGGLQGGLAGLGGSEADTVGGNLLDAGKGAAFGAAAGAGTNKLAEWLSGKLAKGAQAADNSASKFAESAAGLDRTQGLRKRMLDEIENETVNEGEIGKFLRDNKLVKATDSAADIAGKISKQKDVVGGQMSEILSQGAPADVTEIANKLQAQTQKYQNSGVNSGTVDELLRTAKNYQKLATPAQEVSTGILDRAGNPIVKGAAPTSRTIPLSQVNADKADVGKQVKDFLSSSPSKQAGRDTYGVLSETVKNNIPDNLKDGWAKATKDYSFLKHVDDASKGRVAALDGKHVAGFDKVVPATIGGSLGGIPGALAAVGAKAVKDARGPQLAMGGMEKLSNLLGSLGQTSQKIPTAAAPFTRAATINSQQDQDGDAQLRALLEMLGRRAK